MVPTIGRRMYYCTLFPQAEGFTSLDVTQPFDAGVVFVHTPQYVNLVVTDHIGNTKYVENVFVKTTEDQTMVGHSWVEWMPYQKAKAAEEESKPYAAVPHVPQ